MASKGRKGAMARSAEADMMNGYDEGIDRLREMAEQDVSVSVAEEEVTDPAETDKVDKPMPTGEVKVDDAWKGIAMLIRESNANSELIRKDIEYSRKREERRGYILLLAICGMTLLISGLFAVGGYWVYSREKQSTVPVAAVYDSGENQLLVDDLKKQVVSSSGNTILAMNRELAGVNKKLDDLLSRKPETVVKNYYNRPSSKPAKKKKVRTITLDGEKIEVIPFVPDLPKHSGLK